MSQIQTLKNQDLNTEFRPFFEQTYSKTSDLEIILHGLYHKENEIFNHIVMTIKTNDNTHSMMLASELIRVRILKRNICVALELAYRYKLRHA